MHVRRGSWTSNLSRGFLNFPLQLLSGIGVSSALPGEPCKLASVSGHLQEVWVVKVGPQCGRARKGSLEEKLQKDKDFHGTNQVTLLLWRGAEG